MNLLSFALAPLAAASACALAWHEYRRTRELFTPWTLILLYAVIDVFLPGTVFLIAGSPSFPLWIVPLRGDDIQMAILVYAASLVFFAAGYFLALHGRPSNPSSEKRTISEVLSDVNVRVGRVYTGLVLTGSWYVSYQLTLISKAGSLNTYLSDSFRQRYRPEVYVPSNLVDFVFNQFAPAMLPAFLVLVGILFFFRYRYHRKVLWGVVLPLSGWLLTLTTFYRGSQLNFFLSLALLETCRIGIAHIHPHSQLGRTRAPGHGLLSTRAKVLASVGVVLFVLYGAFRQYNSSFQYGRPVSAGQALSSQAGEFLRGWGVVGLTSVLHAYPASDRYIGGSSFTSTLLMPVPRLIWPDKPERYGAEVVTRRMGWLTTTQSAITMPGELYANFGLAGILFTGVFGLLFGMIYRLRLRPTFFFAYAFFLPQAVLLTHWMSSTGLMTALTLLPVSALGAWLVIVPGATARDERWRRFPPVKPGERALPAPSRRPVSVGVANALSNP